MLLAGIIDDYDVDTGTLIIHAKYDNVMDVARKQYRDCEVRLDDGRTISAEQRRKTYALIRDIASWSGHYPEEVKEFTKWDFRGLYGYGDFSLSNVDMTTSKEYINYLIEFCIKNDVPCLDSLLNRTDDISSYLYACLFYGKCAICGKDAEIHHHERIGIGRDRRSVVHLGMEAISLCRVHHNEAHSNAGFCDKYHIYGIKLDKIICNKRRLNIGASLESEDNYAK